MSMLLRAFLPKPSQRLQGLGMPAEGLRAPYRRPARRGSELDEARSDAHGAKLKASSSSML